ncbi:MAG: trehalose-phosphatase, partial [Sphaerobacteraceae bacterium]
VRPPVELSKGTSVAELAAEYELDGLIYLGDDVTDVDAFRALARIRTEQGLEFHSVGVRNDPTPQEVIDYADAMVDGVQGVIELLQQALQQLDRKES